MAHSRVLSVGGGEFQVISVVLMDLVYNRHREIKEERKSGNISGEIRIGLKGRLVFIPKFYMIIVPMSTLIKSI